MSTRLVINVSTDLRQVRPLQLVLEVFLGQFGIVRARVAARKGLEQWLRVLASTVRRNAQGLLVRSRVVNSSARSVVHAPITRSCNGVNFNDEATVGRVISAHL